MPNRQWPPISQATNDSPAPATCLLEYHYVNPTAPFSVLIIYILFTLGVPAVCAGCAVCVCVLFALRRKRLAGLLQMSQDARATRAATDLGELLAARVIVRALATAAPRPVFRGLPADTSAWDAAALASIPVAAVFRGARPFGVAPPASSLEPQDRGGAESARAAASPRVLRVALPAPAPPARSALSYEASRSTALPFQPLQLAADLRGALAAPD